MAAVDKRVPLPPEFERHLEPEESSEDLAVDSEQEIKNLLKKAKKVTSTESQTPLLHRLDPVTQKLREHIPQPLELTAENEEALRRKYEEATQRSYERVRDKLEQYQGLYPDDLLRKFPELVDFETKELRGYSVLAIDLPKYSSMMEHPQLVPIASRMINTYKERVARIAHHPEEFYRDTSVTPPKRNAEVLLLKSAGDELLLASDADQLELMLFGLKAQTIFEETMDEFPEVRKFYQDEGIEDPEVHIGVNTPNDDSNEHVMLRRLAVNTNKDGTRKSHSEIMVMGGTALEVKEMAREFVTQSFGLVRESRLSISDKELEAFGLNVEYISDQEHQKLARQGSVYQTKKYRKLTVNREKGATTRTIAAKLDVYLQNQREQLASYRVGELREVLTPEHANDAEKRQAMKIWEAAESMVPPYCRDQRQRAPEHIANPETPQAQGEAAYISLNGLDVLKNVLEDERTQAKLFMDQTAAERQRSAMLLLSIAAEVSAKELGQILMEAGWDIKETEFDKKYGLRLIALNNILSENKNQGEQQEAIRRTMYAIKTEQLKQKIKDAIIREFRYQRSNEQSKGKTRELLDHVELNEIFADIKFDAWIGLVEADGDQTQWSMHNDLNQQEWTGGVDVTGSLISFSARLSHYGYSGRYFETLEKLRTKEGDLTSEELEQYKQLALLTQMGQKNGAIIMTSKMADEYGLLAEIDGEIKPIYPEVVSETVSIKGFKKPVTLYFYSP